MSSFAVEQQNSAHQILGISHNASAAEVKAAYRQLVRQWHPDQFVDAEKKRQAEAKIKEINIAYDCLKRGTGEAAVHPDVNPGKNSTSAQTQTSAAQTRVSVAQDAEERKRKRAKSLYQQAQELATAERFREATDALDQAIRIYYDYLEAYEYRGSLYEKRGFHRLAEKDFAKVRALKRAAAQASTQAASPTSEQTWNDSRDFASRTRTSHATRRSSHRRKKNGEPEPSSSSSPGPSSRSTESWSSSRKNSASSSTSGSPQARAEEEAAVGENAPLPFQRPTPLKAEKIVEQSQAKLHEHSGAITAIALLRKNNYVTASQDGTLRFWSFKRGAEQPASLAVISEQQHPVEKIAASPDGQHLASYGSEQGIKIWRVQDTSLRQQFPCPPLTSLCFAASTHALIGCDREGVVQQWDLSNSQTQPTAQSIGSATYLTLTQNLKHRLVRSSDQTLCTWAIGKESALHHLDGSRFEQTALCISDDDKSVAAGDRNGTVFCWHLKTGQATQAFSGFTQAIQAIAINPDRIMAVIDSAGTIWIVDLVTRKLRTQLLPQSAATRLCFAPNYNHLLSGHQDGSVQIWRV